MGRARFFVPDDHEAIEQDFQAVIGKGLQDCIPGAVCKGQTEDVGAGGIWYILEGEGLPHWKQGQSPEDMDLPDGLMDALYRRRGLDKEGKPI